MMDEMMKHVQEHLDDCEELKELGFNLAILEYAKLDPVFSLQTSNQALKILCKYTGKEQIEAMEWYHDGYNEGVKAWTTGGHSKYTFNPTTGEFTSKRMLKLAEPAETKRFRIMIIY